MRVTVERLGHLGDGIAPGPVLVPRALPGEVAEGAVEGGRMAAPRIVTPSPARVAAPCPHYGACGGCALMHADDAFVAGWKVDVVRRALSSQGLPAPVAGIATSPPLSRRRATLGARRTKAGTLVGFHARASDTLTEIPGCRLLVPAIRDARPLYDALTRAGGSRKGRLEIAVTAGEAGLDVAVAGGKPLDPALRVTLTGIAETWDVARLSWDGDTVVTRRSPLQPAGSARVVPPPGAFLQATAHGQAALTAAVGAAVAGAGRIVDLFAGCGTFALPLARTAELHAVEGEAEMLSALDAAWRRTPGLRRLTTEARDLFRRPLTADEFAIFDAAVIDPPRAGAEAQTAALAAGGPPRIAAVSCNPVTFARDARLLCDGGYRLDRVLVVDQFRWSPHVEVAATFLRGHIPPD
ncbi:class I SAM-dependent RNA methyltransferase [Rhodobacteraceae bacterium CCMM004]|nr:class I SAM-dependent RNA methyltransferase [Rhodobacteraceae bacterium CCMM004]